MTKEPFGVALQALLREEGLSMRDFAERIGFTQSYISRTVGAATTQRRRISLRLVEASAEYFDLPDDYFLEWRQERVAEAAREDADYCDRCYRLLAR